MCVGMGGREMERVMEGEGWCVTEMQTLGREGWGRAAPQGTGWGRSQEGVCDPVWDPVGMGRCVLRAGRFVQYLCLRMLSLGPWSQLQASSHSQELASGIFIVKHADVAFHPRRNTQRGGMAAALLPAKALPPPLKRQSPPGLLLLC